MLPLQAKMTEEGFSKIECLSGTVLKLIAVVSMTIDHIGYIFFPHQIWFRILGRLSFPIFAYMIAEGCYYTKNKKKYLCMMLGIGVLCQAAMLIFANSWELNIMFTLGLSAVLIFLLQWALGRKDVFLTEKKRQVFAADGPQVFHAGRFCVLILAILVCAFIAVGLKKLCPGFRVDYGIFGILLAFVIYIPPKHYQKLITAGIWMIFLSMNISHVQWYCLFALIPLALYSGRPGRHRMKYFFYLYYPIHLAILWGIYFLRSGRF